MTFIGVVGVVVLILILFKLDDIAKGLAASTRVTEQKAGVHTVQLERLDTLIDQVGSMLRALKRWHPTLFEDDDDDWPDDGE